MSTPSSPTVARLHRTAGWGGIAAVLAWVAQPIVVGILAASEGDSWPTIETLRARPYSGALEALIFMAIALGLLTLVLSLDRVAARAGERTLPWRIGTLLGVVAALAFLGTSGLTLAQFTSVGAGLAEVAPDLELQAALLDVIAVVIAGTLSLFALAGAGWLIVLGTSGRRAGVVGLPLAIFALVCAALPVVSLALPFAPPWASLGPLLFALVGGIAFLAKSSRARRVAA